MLITVTIIALALGLVHAAPSSPPKSDSKSGSLEVDLGYTKYEGHKLADGINQWLGMRYAAPPTGKLRFKAPEDPPKSDKKKADKHGALCHFTPTTKINKDHSEDCLFIDVAAPADKKTPHPVYFFIQGGGFNTLANANPLPEKLINAADKNIVVVTFNYRVGPWGFLASKEVKKDGNLNVGLLDQRKALKWVQKNIHLFGGDPKHVTIDGDSAGAASVDLHLTAYGGKDDGLFHAAIGQSNSFGAQLTVEESQYQYDGLVNRTGCAKDKDTLGCLRKLKVEDFAKHNTEEPTPGAKGKPVFMYSNVIEGPGGFTEDYTYSMFGAGKFVKVPSMFGSVTNEGTTFTPPDTKTVDDMKEFLHNNWVKLTKDHLKKIVGMYPKDKKKYDKKGEYWRAAADAYGAMRYRCPAVYLNKMVDKHAKGDANWQYQWDVVNAGHKESGLGVTHVAEVAAIWGGGTAEEKPLSPIIQGYWTSFIRSKNPNTHRKKDTPEWKVWGKSKSRLNFPNDPKKVGMKDIDSKHEKNCDYFSSIGKTLGM